MRNVTVSTQVEVDVDLDDIDIDDMIEYIEDNGYKVIEEDDVSSTDIVNHLRAIDDKRRMKLEYQNELDHLLKDVLGRAL